MSDDLVKQLREGVIEHRKRLMMQAADRIEALEARAEKAEAERDALRGVARQAIDVIESVQTYSQPDDPTEENALTMGEHEVFGFDIESARAALNREKNDE